MSEQDPAPESEMGKGNVHAVIVDSRSDCRLIARLAKMGAIPPERVQGLVEQAVRFAEQAGKRDDLRAFNTAMRTVVALAACAIADDKLAIQEGPTTDTEMAPPTILQLSHSMTQRKALQ